MVAGAHGVDGRVRVQRDTDNPQRFRRNAQLWIAGASYRIERIGGAGDVLLVKLAGVDTKEDAAALLHEPVLVPTSALPALPRDTYYHYQLLAMTVRTSDGEDLGTLSEVLTTGANDVYVVRKPDRELLVPAIADVVQQVDVESSVMTVSLPEGLEWRDIKPAKPASARPKRRRGPRRKPPLSSPPPSGQQQSGG
ncbi:MAG: ribosome maturation factor RimM [Dehalococcoidia bacterium]